MTVQKVTEQPEGKLVCEAFEKLWFTLADMISDMRNKGINPPQQVSVALEGARVMINLCKFHPDLAHVIGPQTLDSVQGFCVTCCGQDVAARIECELRNVEDLMIVKAVNTLGERYVIPWQIKLEAGWKEVGEHFVHQSNSCESH